MHGIHPFQPLRAETIYIFFHSSTCFRAWDGSGIWNSPPWNNENINQIWLYHGHGLTQGYIRSIDLFSSKYFRLQTRGSHDCLIFNMGVHRKDGLYIETEPRRAKLSIPQLRWWWLCWRELLVHYIEKTSEFDKPLTIFDNIERDPIHDKSPLIDILAGSQMCYGLNLTTDNSEYQRTQTTLNQENFKRQYRSSVCPFACLRYFIGFQTLRFNFNAEERIFRLIWSIPCLLMPWLLKSAGHQQEWYCQNRVGDMWCCYIVNLVFFFNTKSKLLCDMWIHFYNL